MPFLTVPDGTHAVSSAGQEFVAENGLIDVSDATPHAMEGLMTLAGCTLATDIDVMMATNAAAERAEKASVRAELDALGVPYDARLSATTLARSLRDAKAKRMSPAAAAKAATAAAKLTAASPEAPVIPPTA